MKVLISVYLILSSISDSKAENGPICYNCKNLPLPHVCDEIRTCGPHETCYVERFVSPDGVTYYESGCKEKNETCGVTTEKRFIFPDCSECCSTNYCNKHMCSSVPFSPLTRCLQCSKVFSPKDCRKVTTCTHDELCHTQEVDNFGYTFFNMGCLSKSACSAEYVFGRRNLEQKRNEKCHQCCHGENCNRDLCERDNIVITTNKPTTNNVTPLTFNFTQQICYTLNPYMKINAETAATTFQLGETLGKLKRDCLDYYNSNYTENGIYKISPDNKISFFVYCDMVEGGWTVIQRHTCRAVNFTRGWNDYVNGFGDLHGDHWLGLEHIHLLTNPPCDIILEGIPLDTNETATSKYSSFTLDGAALSYTMHCGNGVLNSVATSHGYDYWGGFSAHNNNKFQTYDHINGNNCASDWSGGWWYDFCYYVNLNTLYSLMDFRARHPGGRVKASQMKVRRV